MKAMIKRNNLMKLVDLKGLSERTPLSVFTFRKYVKIGMPHYRVGRKILVNPEEFEAWFQQFKSGSTQARDNLGHLVDETLKKLA
jgi:hypothetical protein